MRAKNYIRLLLLLFGLEGLAQKAYKFPESFNQIYNFKPDQVVKELNNAPEQREKGERVNSIISESIYNEQFEFDYNYVYMDWHEVEVYLLKILNKILPNNPDAKKVDLFLARRISANAHVNITGRIFFNVGLLSQAENEAYIAAILAHEVGHYVMNHNTRGIEDYNTFIQQRDRTGEKFYSFRRKSRRMELQADSFAIRALVKAGMSIEPLMAYHEDNSMSEFSGIRSKSYLNMLKASQLTTKEINQRRLKVYDPSSTHPSSVERYAYVRQSVDGCISCGSKFFVDSVFFMKLKRMAREERKKIAFERCNYSYCSNYSFVDYLYEPKNVRNLYFLIEATRRTLYINPGLATKGFLTEYVNDDELFYNNRSVLHKPEYLFDTYKEYIDLKGHPFLTDEKKPFETYEQALFYFISQAQKLNMNEANLSLGLYYMALAKHDSARKYLQKYISSGNGLYAEYAGSLLSREKPFAQKGRMLFIYDNLSAFISREFSYSHSLKHKASNPSLMEKFGKDTNKVKLVIANEWLGTYPRYLSELQKISWALASLYDEDDIEMCKKIRLKSHYAGEDREIPVRNKKLLTIYQPELFGWLKERKYDRVFVVQVVYNYHKATDSEEFFNNYTGYYLDMNEDRPYFKDAYRGGFKQKQKEKEIHDEIYSFLYE